MTTNDGPELCLRRRISGQNPHFTVGKVYKAKPTAIGYRVNTDEGDPWSVVIGTSLYWQRVWVWPDGTEVDEI